MEVGQYNAVPLLRVSFSLVHICEAARICIRDKRAHIIEADTIASALTTARPKFTTIGSKMCELAMLLR